MNELRHRQTELYDGVRRAYALSTIYDLKINDILLANNIFMSAVDIASQIEGRSINPIYLERILRYLVCFGVFEEKYVNDIISFKATEFFKLPEFKLLTCLYKCSARYQDLLEDKTEGETLWKSTMGSHPWEFLSKEPYVSNFMIYMTTVTSLIEPCIPQLIEEMKDVCKEQCVIVDVGGSDGGMMKHIKTHMPNVSCINFDLPQVINKVKPIEGVEMVSGDMFDAATIPKCDVIFTKNILHDWTDEKCEMFLKNFYTVLQDDGILLSINYHLAEPGDEGYPNWFNRTIDLTMMEIFGEARERSLKEYQKLHQKAGFEVIRYTVLGPKEEPVALLICKKIL